MLAADDPSSWPSVARAAMAETEGATAAPISQQLIACAQGEVGRSQPGVDPAGQSVREAQSAQASAGWTMPRRHARSTIEAISRRTTNATSGPSTEWPVELTFRDPASGVNRSLRGGSQVGDFQSQGTDERRSTPGTRAVLSAVGGSCEESACVREVALIVGWLILS